MLAIKECLIREGVLNLTSTANHGNSTSLTAKQGNGGADGDGDGDDGGDGGIENTAVGGNGAAGAGANNTATYRNHNYNDNVVGNNLRAISTNYTRNSDNRNNRNYDMASSLALDFQSVRLTDQISVDAARRQNTDTNNENKSSNCSLSSASATANSSCQQTSIYDKSKHLQQQKQQRVPATGSKSSTRYQGVHPHFHHHTAPSYYTDVNLHIHTPKANDVAALNENYQSVYNTPSQLVNERHFPKTSTATVVPPPIGTGTAAIGRANTTSPTSIAKRDRESVSANSSSNIKNSSSSSARAAFFRGGSVGSNSNGERKSCEHFTKSSPAFGRPTKKGEFNDTSYTPYDISGSSFVVGTLSSSDCSKTNQLDNTTDTHTNTNHNNNHNSNNNIPLTSPTSAGHTSASASATASASASASASGRSRNSNRFAGKKRAVRVRSESRPISALYDIICKEKGLDIGTSSSSSSSSTTNEEEHSASASNDDEKRGAHSKRSTNSKERCRQRSGSGSRNSNRNNSNDYSEISNRLTAFVAKSLSNHSGEFVGQSNMDNVATVNSAAVDTKAAHDRSKRSHKSRTPSSQKSASKKRKDVGKTKASVMRCAMSDDEPNNETSEDSNELRAHAVLSPLTKYHTEFSHKMNSTEKASSLPPRLQSATRTSSSSVKQALQPHKASCHANTDLSTYPIVKKCPVHSRCDLVDCDYHLSSAPRPSHYTHAHHQSSLPPNLSSGPCSSIRSPSTADDDSLMVVNSLGYSPDKLFFEPVNMTLSSVSSGAVSGKNVNSSSSGVVFDQTSARSNQRIGRAQHRRLREELRRHTDLPLLDMLSPNSLISQLSTTERALSEDEGVAGVKQQKSRTSKARRFINRPSHTPTHGRSGNSANGSPHPIRRNSNKQNSESSSSASSPAPTNRRNSSANGINSINRPTVVPPINTVAAVAGVTIEDVGSASSGDHLNHHIKLSPLQIMTNSATPASELPPRANGSAALGEGEAHPEAHEDTGNGSISGVQTIISATEVVHQRKHDANTHKTPSNTIIRPISKTTTTTITSAIISNKTPTHLNQRNQQQWQHQQQQPYNKSNKHTSFFSQNNSTFNSNSYSHSNSNSNNSYAMPTETFLLKQKNAMLAVSGATTNTNVKKKPLSPLQIITIPTSPTTAHQLSHQQHSQSTDVGGSQQQSGYLTQMPPTRRQSPLAAAPPSPFSLARSPLSPCSPHYVRPTKASRLRAAALDKKKCEDDPLQRPRSPCYGSASSPRSSASPKHQLSRLSTSSSSDNPNITASSESDTKLIGDSSRATIGSLYSTSSNDSPTATKKLVPSVSVSVKQNLCEMQFNGDISASGSPKKTIGSRLKKARTIPSPSTECTATFTRSAGRLSTADESDSHLMLKAGKSIRPRTSTMKSAKSKSISDLKAGSAENSPNKLELSPVDSATQPSSPREDRDKSSKRKSNLNRSLNDEATLDSDDSLAARRRRRRELGMVRQLVPSDDLILREMLLPHQKKSDSAAKKTTIGKSSENELAYHMEMARRGWDLANPSINNRARSETATTKYESNSGETVKEKPSNARLARRSDTLHLGELRKLRSNDVNRKMNERTKSDLAEIKKIAEQANIEMAMMTSGIVTELAELAVSNVDCEQEAVVELATPARYGIGSRSQASPPPTPSFTELEMAAEAKERDPSPAKHATFMQEERFYYDPETSDQISKSVSNNTMASGILRQRILKARSIERDAAHEPPKLSPILRRKSTDDPPCITAPPTSAAGIHSTSQNHIVSILKKKDHIAGESSSASSNASPVTFSANVVDTPTTKQKRAGILKKRSSLDESRYYSRSHSPDERSILIKSARRNSLEETAGLQQQQQQQQQHGILKQSSYESSKSDGCPSATEPHPHSILKKKDSTSTPSDGGTHAPKHVSISQAVKMAAAELCRQTADSQSANTEHEESGYTPNNEEYEIRPILKLESASSDDVMRPPKPILKKKSSGDSDEYEIRPILKTSRKSSREEFDLSGSLSEDGRHYSEPPQPPPVRPILKTDSPSKRRSLGIDELEQDASSAEYVSNSPSLLKRRTRSLERQEPPVVDLAAALNAIATSQAAPLDFVSTPITTGGNISVAERIKNMEKFLSSNGASPSTPADANSSWDSPLLHTDITPRLLKPSVIRRDMYRDRYKTQPVTNDEKMLFKATASPLDISATSAFKPTKSLDAGLNYTAFAHSNAASNASLGSSYTLTRCSTQSLHGQNHFDAAGTSSVVSPPLRAVIGRLNSLSDSYNNSGSEQLTHSVGSDSERIFEMSGIEENAAAAAASTLNDKSEVGVGAGIGGTGLARKNSVRARANMFQQLQEKTKSEEAATAESSASTATTFNREEQTSPRRAPRQLSPTPTMFATPPILSSSMASAANASCSEEHKTPQVPARTEEEIAESSSRLPPPTKSAFEAPAHIKGILKSKSGCVGFMPMDLSSELKNRLKSSTHASVTNLRKSATTHDATRRQDAEELTTTAAAVPQHDDALSLVRNLSNLGRPPTTIGAGSGGGVAASLRVDAIASTSEGESSGGREISEIIKNSAVARRRKLNDGYQAKVKPSTKFWPYQFKPPQPPPPQHEQT